LAQELFQLKEKREAGENLPPKLRVREEMPLALSHTPPTSTSPVTCSHSLLFDLFPQKVGMEMVPFLEERVNVVAVLWRVREQRC